MSMARNLLDLRVRCDEFAPAAVRRAVADVAEVARPGLEDTKLVASELVSNAVRHSRCSDAEFLSVCVAVNGGLRISVFDPGRSSQGAERANRPLGVGGMGLKVVAKLARRWGAERRAAGYECGPNWS